MGKSRGELALPLVCHEVVWVWVWGLPGDALLFLTVATCSSQENWPEVTRDGELTRPPLLTVALGRANPAPHLDNVDGKDMGELALLVRKQESCSSLPPNPGYRT